MDMVNSASNKLSGVFTHTFDDIRDAVDKLAKSESYPSTQKISDLRNTILKEKSDHFSPSSTERHTPQVQSPRSTYSPGLPYPLSRKKIPHQLLAFPRLQIQFIP